MRAVSGATASTSYSTRSSVQPSRVVPLAMPRHARAHPSGPRRLTVAAAGSRQSQSGGVATKRRLSGPPNLPPINDGGGGGGGGDGDGWNWERTARNLAPNLAFLALYFGVTTWGGDGWGGGFFGHGGGGGGGGGGGDGWGDGGQHGNPAQNNSSTPSNKDEQEEEEGTAAYSYASSYRPRSSYR